jgi:glycosyltransferase involved in cell wall biosynthesis
LTGWKRALLKYFWFTGPMWRAAVVTTISEASKEELRKWVGPLADKVVVVPDCVFEEFAYDPKPFNEARPVVLQVGTKWNKNVERVMEALRGTGCRLEIVGKLEKASHGLTRINTDILRAEDLGAKSCSSRQSNSAPEPPGVRELGRLTDEELVEAYRRCDMVVFASLYEGFGLPILEAQAMGRPVITSNFGAMREAAGDGALLVDPYSVDEIREAILRIKNEPALREELVRKGRENAERFRADAIALKYAQIYRALATD